MYKIFLIGICFINFLFLLISFINIKRRYSLNGFLNKKEAYDITLKHIEDKLPYFEKDIENFYKNNLKYEDFFNILNEKRLIREKNLYRCFDVGYNLVKVDERFDCKEFYRKHYTAYILLKNK